MPKQSRQKSRLRKRKSRKVIDLSNFDFVALANKIARLETKLNWHVLKDLINKKYASVNCDNDPFLGAIVDVLIALGIIPDDIRLTATVVWAPYQPLYTSSMSDFNPSPGLLSRYAKKTSLSSIYTKIRIK